MARIIEEFQSLDNLLRRYCLHFFRFLSKRLNDITVSYSLNPKHIISLYCRFSRTLILLMVCAITLGCQPHWEETKLSQIVKQNALHVGIINGPQTYFMGNAGAAGFDYELASNFADYLGVNAVITVFYDHGALQVALQQGDIDIAITGDALCDDPACINQYGPVLHYVNQVLVTSTETPNLNPETPITVVANSSNHKLLTGELNTLPGKIDASYDMDKHEILRRVATGELAATVVDSNTLSILRTRYPQLAIHQVVALHQKVAWSLSSNSDDSLLAALYEFISQSRGSGTVAALETKYFDNQMPTPLADMDTMVPLAHGKIQALADHFRPLASVLPWQLHAAVAYTQQQWQPMGETLSADLEKLAYGLPARIEGTNRLWMALAAYFGGEPHLADVRTLTAQQGGDPDNWTDVKQRYPRLTEKRFYRHTQAGFVEGDEVLRKVENTISYYQALKVLSAQNEKEL